MHDHRDPGESPLVRRPPRCPRCQTWHWPWLALPGVVCGQCRAAEDPGIPLDVALCPQCSPPGTPDIEPERVGVGR